MKYRNYKTYICADCGEEYVLTPTKPGKINQCKDCGSIIESQKGNSRPGGRISYDCKTNAEIEIIDNLGTMKQILKKMDRVGGQGTPRGMATRR